MRGRLTPSQRLGTAIIASILAFPLSALPPSVQATTGGSPYDIASVLDTNPDPNIVETTIIADETTVDIGGGVSAHAYTYNGTIPGPEFHLKVGDRVIVHFENHLNSEPTGIHWHGIELQNPSDGTPLTQNQVPAGGTYTYDWVARRPGVYWYHPHHEFSTNQVFKGLYGSIIITDPNESALIAAGRLPSLADTRTLALSDVTVCKAAGSNDAYTYDPGETDGTFDPPATFTWLGGATLLAQQAPNPTTLCDTPIDNNGATLSGPLAAGDVPNIQRTSGRVNEGQTVLTNGVNVGGRAGTPSAPGALDAGAQALDVHPGQGLRLRIGDAATTRFFHLHLRDNTGASVPLYRVGGEGGLLDNVKLDGGAAPFDWDYNAGEILLDPGDRTDVVIAFPVTATGVWTLWTEDFRRTGNGDSANGWTRTPTVPVAHFNVTGAAVPAFTIADGTPLRSSIPNAAVEALPAATGHLLDPLVFPTPQAGMALEDIQLTTPQPSINGVVGTHDFTIDYTLQEHMDSNRWAFIGDVLQLTVTNTTPADHPFHLHGFSIQPLTFTSCQTFGGTAQPTYTFPHEFMDNIDLPGNCTLTLRVRLDDRPFPDGTPGGGIGRWMFHCHIFFHHHQGMVSELTVVKPDVAITSVAPTGLVYAVGTNVTVTTSSLGLLAPTYDWDDNGVTTVGAPAGGANFTSSHTFTQAGVYTVKTTVTRNGFSDSDSVMFVVFDPSAGYVTGSGTIASGAGAYTPDLTLAGTASFGFVSKYQKGATTPNGQTEFNFQVANFGFHSTAYEWLVVSGAKAQYKGTGTVNGAGHFGFLLSAVDGDINGGGGVDKFRIKIWDMDNADAIVYDNNKGASDDIDNAGPQALKSGSIVIHSK